MFNSHVNLIRIQTLIFKYESYDINHLSNFVNNRQYYYLLLNIHSFSLYFSRKLMVY